MRVYNFSAGPAMLPVEVLAQAQSEFLNWQSLGLSVLEVGHRTKVFQRLLINASNQLRDILLIPPNYHILFLGSPARLQFSSIALNFINPGQQALYWITGLWSSTAHEEACHLNKKVVAAKNHQEIKEIISNANEQKIAYFYFTPNETVQGIREQLPSLPESIPVVADMTSCLLTEPINIQDYSLIFAGAQKNIANAGLTTVIIKDDFLNSIKNKEIPSFLDYRIHVINKSLFCTPPTFNCYLADKMFKWIIDQGGLNYFYSLNQKKSRLLYDYIDDSSFYYCNIPKAKRSLVNICFDLHNSSLTETFLNQAAREHLVALEGHRSVGGLRASIYNAMPLKGVERLVEFMTIFASQYEESAL